MYYWQTKDTLLPTSP
uniref:Uncharacterized protein n=1 Tax=Rhizophora mucronata TaxID=61149 RepID=A0A2P2QLE5_RHIMU